MVVQEYYSTRSDGVVLIKSYSDQGVKIERDGILYDEAIDPEFIGRTYTETNEPVYVEELSAEEALSIITGGEL